MNMAKRLGFIVIFVVAIALAACESKRPASAKLQVVATIFPVYDFARHIGGDKAEVTMLLPPGVESHSFEPRPEDIIRVSRAGLFIFTNRYMEPWAMKIAGSVSGKAMVVDAGKGIAFAAADGRHRADDGHAHEEAKGVDPHVWLDFANAGIMVDNILAAFAAKDPQHRAYYATNAAALKDKLAALDEQYKSGLAQCTSRSILHGGHFAFGYLARRYDLDYQSAYAFNASAEPTAARLAQLIEEMKKSGAHYIYTEELLSPRVAETIARETGAGILKLNGAHNIAKQDFDRGVTFISLMEENLKNLRTGLQCR
jgi:zinc transport system substrate-binding protein